MTTTESTWQPVNHRAFTAASSARANADNAALALCNTNPDHHKARDLDALRALNWTATDAERAIAALVTQMRAEAVSWERIGDALNLTRQGAQQRFGRLTGEATSSRRRGHTG